MVPTLLAIRPVEPVKCQHWCEMDWWLSRSYIFVAIAGALLLTLCPGISAQEYLTATGKPASATTEPVEMGFIDLSSGALHLEIPLGSFPQRAHAEPLTLRLTYENHVWNATSDGSTVYWEPPTSIYNSDPANWNLSTGGWGLSPFSGGAYLCDTDFGVVEPSGTQHFFHIVVGDGNSSCSNSSGDFYATDSSGFRLHVIDWPHEFFIVYAPDGTIMPFYSNDPTYNDPYGHPFASEDSNGNYLVVNVGPFAAQETFDTVHRIFGNDIQSSPPYPCPPPPNNYPANDFNCFGLPTSQTNSSSPGLLTSWYYMTWVTIPLRTAFGQTGVTECTTNCSMPVLQKITLPDNSSYTFTYDCDSSTGNSACGSPAGQSGYYGTLSTMTLPTGGTVSYSYITFFDVYGNATRYLNSRSLGQNQSWFYNPIVLTTCPHSQVGCQQEVDIYRPDQSGKNVIFTIDNGSWPTSIQNYDVNGALLQSESISWDFTNSCPLYFCTSTYYTSHAYIRKLSNTITNIGGGGNSVTKKTVYTYDGIQKGNVTGVKEWKYQPGTSPQFAAVPDRATYVTYLTAGYNIINKPTKVTVCTSSGTDSDCPGGGQRLRRPGSHMIPTARAALRT